LIAFTCDIDWAPEAVIEDTINLFELFGIKCTFFSTHHSPILTKSNKKLFEIGIHPNFHPLLKGNSDKTFEDILDDLLDIHPEARGVRTHTLMQSVAIIQKFADRRLVYESNTLMPYQTGLKPFKLWNGLVRIPYNWEDDVHWAYGYSFDDCRISLDAEEMIIFDFHPIHIYLNTENKYRYSEAKKYYNDPVKLNEFKNKEVPGTRDLLMNLLKHCRNNEIETHKMIEIAYSCLQNNI
jgi:hypothetical protein